MGASSATTMAKSMSQKMSSGPGKPGNMKTPRQLVKDGIRKQPTGTLADSEKQNRKKKARKERRELGGLVIGGKLRGCEGVADIAFLEWLLLHKKCTQETLWNQYQEDFGDLPSDMCPRSAHKPKNLFSQLNAIVKKAASFKENVAKARNNISGLESGESVLAFVKRTKTAKVGKAKKVAVEKVDGNQQKEKKTEK